MIFFREYLARYGEQGRLENERVVIGLGHSDALSDLSQEKNTFVPRAPVGYSDKTHETVFTLPLNKDLNSKFEVVSREIAEIPKALAVREVETRGVSPLSFEDTLGVAYIEGKAYKDNESLLQYLWGIENTLIAKDITNSAKARPDLSFKHESGGVMRGYFLAYEGRYEAQESESDDTDGIESEQVIYIADFAVKEPGSVASARSAAALLDAFVNRYKTEYLDKNNLIPIVAVTREQTSRRLISRKLDDIASELGVTFDIQEEQPYERGGDQMYQTVIRPRKIP